MGESANNFTINSNDSNLKNTELHAIYKTSRKIIQEYAREIERHNRYRTARADMVCGTIMDNRGALIDLYEACMQQDAHIRSVVETLESQVLGERYMLAKVNKNTGKLEKDIENSKKIQGTQFVKIIKAIYEAKLYGYSLIELGSKVDPITGRLKNVKIIERRNVLPDQNYVTKRQGQILPGWRLSEPRFQKDYILVNSGDLGMFSATTPLLLAKKFTFANYVGFTQTYGHPIIQGKTADEGTIAKSQLANEIANSASQRIIVTGLQDELQVHALAMSNSERIYMGLIEMANAEVSNLILGSESMAGATQSYAGSTSAHQDIFRHRIEVYREYIENVMNEEIIPRLVKKGIIDSGLEFVYSNKIEMSNTDRIALYKILVENYDVPESEIEKEFGVIVNKPIEPTEKPIKKPAKVEAKANFLEEE